MTNLKDDRLPFNVLSPSTFPVASHTGQVMFEVVGEIYEHSAEHTITSFALPGKAVHLEFSMLIVFTSISGSPHFDEMFISDT